ncbi:ysdA [Symbiodinium natans]|uniref:YsdA protein n=1 Tax=Symbiodinium natans TaxID=878477 RepID=A0A812NGQ5_9DINO|nr:ysdA [Symbiodinium natans]
MQALPPAGHLLAAVAGINGGTAGLFWYDKRQAQEKKWRVSESALCATALVGGWPAGYFAMHNFRHKSAKKSFQDKYAAATSCNLLLCGLHPQARSQLRRTVLRWLRRRR